MALKQLYYKNLKIKNGVKNLQTQKLEVLHKIRYSNDLLKYYLKWIVVKKNGNIHFGIKKSNLLDCLRIFKKHIGYLAKQLLDIIGVDMLLLNNNNYRFELIYVLLSPVYNTRFFVHINVNLFELIETASILYKSADWLEREIFDLFGVLFKGHKNMRRILTDYGFLGHPGRKDFPLTGFKELRYDDAFESIVQEPLELAQEFRFFKLEESWRKWN